MPRIEARIEAMLSARLFLSPRLVRGRVYFISNLSGRLSLYVMDEGGSVPQPLLPPHIALQNPDLIDDGVSYEVFPRLGRIVVMLDNDGDENYQPMAIPLDGGFPEPLFDGFFAHDRVSMAHCDTEHGIIYLTAQSRGEPLTVSYQADLTTGALLRLGESPWLSTIAAASANHARAIILEGYTPGDVVLFEWTRQRGERRPLYGTPMEQRAEGQDVPLSGLMAGQYTPSGRGLLCISALFEDTYSLGYLPLDGEPVFEPVTLEGTTHRGAGEVVGLEHLTGNRYRVDFNIDGSSWSYEALFDEEARRMTVSATLCGTGALSAGVMESIHYDEETDRHALSFSTASSPTQLYIVSGRARESIAAQTHERILGIAEELLSRGEDASFESFDGLRISARLYLPAPALGFTGPRPLVYYVHGGPQGQERPDFSWFSMPLIQFLTLNGFAVFVPNARGSSGYGLDYMKRVDRDWGGQDRLDHVHAMGLLARDPRIDTSRAGVTGRSYGGYMTLTLAARHPELWSAAIDMFGPYNLITSVERFPETWKPYFYLTVGHPERDRDELLARSPSTYIENLACPLMVIQGRNDPRVLEQESRDLVERLRAIGKSVEFIVFEDEGHDVIKFENRVRCYTAMTDFFKEHLAHD